MITALQAREKAYSTAAAIYTANSLFKYAEQEIDSTAECGGRRTSLNISKYQDDSVVSLTAKLENLGFIVSGTDTILFISWEREHVIP